jgi:hypothetical protein
MPVVTAFVTNAVVAMMLLFEPGAGDAALVGAVAVPRSPGFKIGAPGSGRR